MRYMMMIKANADYEAGRPPSPALITAMGALAEEMMHAGLMESSGGLLPSAMGTRLAYTKGRRTVIDGPFAETKELVGGFFIIEAQDLNDAVRIASKHPAAHLGGAIGWGIEVLPIEKLLQVTQPTKEN